MYTVWFFDSLTNRSLGKAYEPAHKEDLCVRVSVLTASIELESLPPVSIVNMKKSQIPTAKSYYRQTFGARVMSLTDKELPYYP